MRPRWGLRLSLTQSHVVGATATVAAPPPISTGGSHGPPTSHLPPVEMVQRDKFMLDLNGYLIVDNFLTAAEVRALNASFDANWERRSLGSANAKRHAVDQFHGMLGWPRPHSQPFRDLLAHPKLLPYLNTILGPGWCVPSARCIAHHLNLLLLIRRMDHSPFMLTSKAGFEGDPGGGMHVHGGGQVRVCTLLRPCTRRGPARQPHESAALTPAMT